MYLVASVCPPIRLWTLLWQGEPLPIHWLCVSVIRGLMQIFSRIISDWWNNASNPTWRLILSFIACTFLRIEPIYGDSMEGLIAPHCLSLILLQWYTIENVLGGFEKKRHIQRLHGKWMVLSRQLVWQRGTQITDILVHEHPHRQNWLHRNCHWADNIVPNNIWMGSCSMNRCCVGC